jgi:hypothetical protein
VLFTAADILLCDEQDECSHSTISSTDARNIRIIRKQINEQIKMRGGRR